MFKTLNDMKKNKRFSNKDVENVFNIENVEDVFEIMESKYERNIKYSCLWNKALMSYDLLYAFSRKKDLPEEIIDKIFYQGASYVYAKQRNKIFVSLLQNRLDATMLDSIIKASNLQYIVDEYSRSIVSNRQPIIHPENTKYFCNTGNTFCGFALYFLTKEQVDDLIEKDVALTEHDAVWLINNPNTTLKQKDTIYEKYDCDLNMLSSMGAAKMEGNIYQTIIDSFDVALKMGENEKEKIQSSASSLLVHFLSKNLFGESVQIDICKRLLNPSCCFPENYKNYIENELISNSAYDEVIKHFIDNPLVCQNTCLSEEMATSVFFNLYKKITSHEGGNEKCDYNEIEKLIGEYRLKDDVYTATNLKDENITTMLLLSGFTPEDILVNNSITNTNTVCAEYAKINLLLRDRLSKYENIFKDKDFLKISVSHAMEKIFKADKSMVEACCISNRHIYGISGLVSGELANVLEDINKSEHSEFFDKKYKRRLQVLSEDISAHGIIDITEEIKLMDKNMTYEKLSNFERERILELTTDNSKNNDCATLYSYIAEADSLYELCERIQMYENLITDLESAVGKEDKLNIADKEIDNTEVVL